MLYQKILQVLSKTPCIPTKEPFSYQKSTHSIERTLYTLSKSPSCSIKKKLIDEKIKRDVFLYPKSPAFYQKSPVLYQKSPVLYQKSPSFYPKCSACLQKARSILLNLMFLKSITGMQICDVQHTHVCCNTLQHTATHCNTLQHTATHCNALQHNTAHCSTLQHSATHCNTLKE